MPNQKTIWVILAAVVIIIAITAAVKTARKNSYNNQNNPGQNQPQPATAPSAGNPASGLSYTQALKKYGSNRIQFDPACQAHPNNVTFKAGTQVMFDNRAKVARAINFNGHIFNIAADSYAVAAMVAAKYPAKILVDCGKSQNVATILIQK
jgi:hypothetical protein